jgi:choline dehydrogenase-like flavoprotein
VSENEKQSNTELAGERLSRREFAKLSAAYAAGLAALADRAVAADAPVEYIVIGSGPGGGPLAVNLAKAGHKVVLFEAGSPATDLNPTIAVPVFNPLAATAPEISWDYYVRHYSDQTQQEKDSKYVPAGIPNSTNPRGGIYYPRCSTIGGCSAHNVLLMVYPSNSDFDTIANSFDDPSWMATNMRQYFQRLENCRYLIQAGSLHGTHGWQPTEMIDESFFIADPQILEFMLTTVKTMGQPGDFSRLTEGKLDPNDFQVASNDVQGLYSFPLMRLNGARFGVREHVLQTAALLPHNLIIMTNCLVTRVLFASDGKTATGVEYVQGPSLYRASPQASLSGPLPPTKQMMVSREVIMACGAFNSPQLLKLSGIGPASELAPLGIKTINNLHGVGLNLQDRYELGVLSQMKHTLAYLAPCTPTNLASDPCLAALFAGLGPYTTNVTFLSSILKSTPTAAERDLVLFFAAGYFRGYVPGWQIDAFSRFDVIASLMLRAHNHNRGGTVTLRTADPRDPPEINFHYFGEGTDKAGVDLAACVKGLQLARNINEKLGNIIEKELFPGPNYVGEAGLAEWAQNEAWGHHASCSNQMAPLKKGGVVDNNFKVYGTNNLRVVDASIFPNIPGYYPMVPLLMISEKASDVVLAAAAGS